MSPFPCRPRFLPATRLEYQVIERTRRPGVGARPWLNPVTHFGEVFMIALLQDQQAGLAAPHRVAAPKLLLIRELPLDARRTEDLDSARQRLVVESIKLGPLRLPLQASMIHSEIRFPTAKGQCCALDSN